MAARVSDKNYEDDDYDHHLILGLLGEGQNNDAHDPPKRSKFLRAFYAGITALDRASDQFLDKKKLRNYPKKIRNFFGPFLKVLVIGLLAYLFYYNFTTARAAYFMSLNKNSGQCEQVAKSVSGTFGMDFEGYWTGNTNYNPSRETVLLTLNKFSHTESEYQSKMTSYRTILNQISIKSINYTLPENLLIWMSWISIQIDNGQKTILQFSGSIMSVFDRFSRQAVLSQGSHFCSVVPTCSYNEMNGIVNIKYSYTDYNDESSCTKISSAQNLGYVPDSDGDEFNLKIDMRSLITALAVNKGLLDYSHLVDVHQSINKTIKYNDTYIYKSTLKIDSRYTGMTPIHCFQSMSTIPADSSLPTQICTEKIAGIYAYPFFTHKGMAGQGSYTAYTPTPCNCSDGTGNQTYCSTFDLLSGVIFFGRIGEEGEVAVTSRRLAIIEDALEEVPSSTVSLGDVGDDAVLVGGRRAASLRRALVADTVPLPTRTPSSAPVPAAPTPTNGAPPPTAVAPTPSNGGTTPPAPAPAGPPTVGTPAAAGPAPNTVPTATAGPPPTETQFTYILDMIQRSGSVHNIEEDVYPAAFRAISLGNGKVNSINSSSLSTAELKALENLKNDTANQYLYSFCDDKCALLTINFYDPYSTSINEYFKSVETGSCADSFSMSDSAWESFLDVDNTPSSLIEVYYRCLPFVQQAFITALGATLGLSTFLALIVAVIVLALAVVFGIRGMTKMPEFYDDVTREKVLEELASYLLMVRDQKVKREEDLMFVDNIVNTLRNRKKSIRIKSMDDLRDADRVHGDQDEKN